MAIKWTEFDSNGMHLSFTQDDKDIHKQYLIDIHNAQMKAYEALRSRHGVWSSRRDRYLQQDEKLGIYDSSVMEERYAEWRSISNTKL
jgi:hypothetical protein